MRVLNLVIRLLKGYVLDFQGFGFRGLGGQGFRGLGV